MSLPPHAAAQAAPASSSPVTGAPVVLEEHDDQGRLLGRISMVDGVLHGRMQRFSESGALQMQADYSNGKLDGLLTVFDDHGRMLMSAEYRDARQHGLQRLYASTGGPEGTAPSTVLAEHHFMNGLLHGTSLSYDEAGDVSARLPHMAGRLEGLALFYRHGRKVREARYSAGLLEGASTDFDSEGSVVQVLRYHANLLHGPAQRYWPDGVLMEEQLYERGRPLGPPQRYDAKGRPMTAEDGASSVLSRLERLIRG